MKKQFRDFESAREFVRKLKLSGDRQWREYCKSGKKPDDIPASPERTYKKQETWTSWGDFTGTGRVTTKDRQYCEFTKAKKFVRSLKLKNQKQWYVFTKSENRPDDIPSSPHTVYKKEWKGYSDWLGLDTIASQNKEFRSFESAKEFMSLLYLKNTKEWRLFLKSSDKPDDIPAAPNVVYKNKGWKNLGDFLGNQNQSNRYAVYLSYEDAKKYLEKLNLTSSKEFHEICKELKIPKNIPRSPGVVYKKDWSKNGGWGGFLGTGTIASQLKQFRPYKEAKQFVQKLGLKNYSDWETYCKSGNKPDDIPTAPWTVYKEWKKK